jgi:hypothetical protein
MPSLYVINRFTSACASLAADFVIQFDPFHQHTYPGLMTFYHLTRGFVDEILQVCVRIAYQSPVTEGGYEYGRAGVVLVERSRSSCSYAPLVRIGAMLCVHAKQYLTSGDWAAPGDAHHSIYRDAVLRSASVLVRTQTVIPNYPVPRQYQGDHSVKEQRNNIPLSVFFQVANIVEILTSIMTDSD